MRVSQLLEILISRVKTHNDLINDKAETFSSLRLAFGGSAYYLLSEKAFQLLTRILYRRNQLASNERRYRQL